MPQTIKTVRLSFGRLAKAAQFLFGRRQGERAKCLVVRRGSVPATPPGSHIGAGLTATRSRHAHSSCANRAKRGCGGSRPPVAAPAGAREPTYVIIARDAALDIAWVRLLDGYEKAALIAAAAMMTAPASNLRCLAPRNLRDKHSMESKISAIS